MKTSEETKNLYIKSLSDFTLIFIEEHIEVLTHNVDGPFLELKGNSKKTYIVEILDNQNNVLYKDEIKCGFFIKLNKKYYIDWKYKISENNVIIKEESFSLDGSKVFITMDSKSLGDTISWISYCDEFRKKHNCKVVVSTFWNKFFINTFPEIEFVNPGSVVQNIKAMYKLGWFYNKDLEPTLPTLIPLQQTASNILGLEYNETKPDLDFEIKPRIFKEKYITIATHSTAGCKYWNNPNGWQELVDYLKSKGYKILHVSREETDLLGVTQLKDTSIENTMSAIYHSEFFIGLSSGLSWLSWALGKHVVMISNFTEESHEFKSNCTRIINHSVCNGCWNNPLFKFDKGNWNWCPEHEGTERQFECHKSITSEMVINQIQDLIK
jgi:autotransporter strand-loop-strand O-heptosyltransferase